MTTNKNKNNNQANDFFDLIKELSNENEDFKKIVNEYNKEKAIIEEIVKQRKKKNLSQRDLAILTGIKQPAIARLESMEVTPRLDTILVILDALNLSIDLVDKNDCKTNFVMHRISVDSNSYNYNNKAFYMNEDKGGITHEDIELKYETRKVFA
jgi:transcriptional regulator with XRE-family HTH domain